MNSTMKIKRNLAFIRNHAMKRDASQTLLEILSDEVGNRVEAFIQTNPNYQVTPLIRQSMLADNLGIHELYIKDESERFGLNAFKVTGGIYAVSHILAERLGRKVADLTFDYLKSEEVHRKIANITLISATDGNHGKGIAWLASELNLNCIIRMPKGSTKERLESIRASGADCEITELNYDDTVRYCSDLAEKNNYVLVQDTAWEGYIEIPQWIIQGYSVIAKEICDSIKTPPTHLFLQAGVGSFAASMAGFLFNYYGDACPRIFIVEPRAADCYVRSFASNSYEIVSDEMQTIMAGLACGEPNIDSYQILTNLSEGAFSCDDSLTALGMRIYGNPLEGDTKIISGESGAITLGLLSELCRNKNYVEIAREIDLNKQSTVLLINTEGDTDKERYREIVWNGSYQLTEEGFE